MLGQRRNRLGMPKVNENPRPPNERRVTASMAKQKRQRRVQQGQTINYPGRGGGRGGGNAFGGGGGNAFDRGHGGGHKHRHPGFLKQLKRFERRKMRGYLGKPPKTVATGAPLDAESVEEQMSQLGNNPANALAFSSFKPAPGQVDPRDSNYWSNVNTLLYNTQSQYAAQQQEETRAGLDYQRNFSDLTTNRGRQERSLIEDAMRSGLTRSGYLDTADTEQRSDFLRDYEDLDTSRLRGEQDRSAARTGIIQDFISGERDLAGQATAAYAEQKQEGLDQPTYSRKDMKFLNRLLKRYTDKGRKGHRHSHNPA